MVAMRGANMARGDFTPSFELAMARKDVKPDAGDGRRAAAGLCCMVSRRGWTSC
jgi:hypothetical protein